MATESTFESFSPSFPWPELSTPEPSAQPNSFETLIPARPEHSPAENSSTDVDSAYAGSPEDATESLSLSMLDYRFEHGRRYHAWHDGAYWGPNDEQAQRLQDIAHCMYYITFDERLFLAPVVNPQAILDVGTGTGIWAIDVADEFPAARVTGLDLSPIQPTLVPPSCSFEIDDVTMPWTYESEQFDLIYVREMFGSIPDWSAFFRQCWASLRPGGYIEVVEHSVTPIWDDDTSLDLIYASWEQTIAQIEQVSGKSFSIWRESAQLLEGSGFQDITRRSYKWPISGWSKDPRLRELGRLNQVRLLQAVEDIFLRHLTTTMAWPLDEVQAFIEQIRSTISDEQRHLYQPVTVVYGQKSRHNSELL